jgi:hypothetical protein
MFLTELSPLVQQLTQQPIAFMGGLFTGFLKLSLTEEPVNSWLNQQISAPTYTTNGYSSTPKSITIE